MFGCCHSAKNPQNQLLLHIKKLKYQTEIQIKNLHGEIREKQKAIVQQFNKEKHSRNMSMQASMVEQIVKLKNKIQIYQIAIHQIDKINNYSHHIDNWSKSVETLHPSFRFLLFIESIVKNKDYTNVCQRIRAYNSQLTEADPKQISEQIILHHKTDKQPSKHMCNIYILDLCNKQQLNLEKINSIGHSYRYGL